MKKVFILCSAMAGILFTSCSKDDDQTPEEALVGSWKLQADIGNDDERFLIEGCDAENLIVFRNDGSFEFFEYDPIDGDDSDCKVNTDESESGTWAITSDSTLDVTLNGENTEGTYLIEGTQLTLGFPYMENDESFKNERLYILQ